MGNEPILRPPKRLDKMFTGLSPPLANIQKIQQEVKTIGFFFAHHYLPPIGLSINY